jgi:hypothetical protein
VIVATGLIEIVWIMGKNLKLAKVTAAGKFSHLTRWFR